MTEYIEREKVVSKFEAIKNRGVSLKDAIYLDGVMAVLDTIPAADVAEVRHGRLISTGYDELYCEFGNCTVCGADNPIYNKFCGQCGARMGKEDEHEAG